MRFCVLLAALAICIHLTAGAESVSDRDRAKVDDLMFDLMELYIKVKGQARDEADLLYMKYDKLLEENERLRALCAGAKNNELMVAQQPQAVGNELVPVVFTTPDAPRLPFRVVLAVVLIFLIVFWFF